MADQTQNQAASKNSGTQYSNWIPQPTNWSYGR